MKIIFFFNYFYRDSLLIHLKYHFDKGKCNGFLSETAVIVLIRDTEQSWMGQPSLNYAILGNFHQMEVGLFFVRDTRGFELSFLTNRISVLKSSRLGPFLS